jgi:hypothetical protein
LKGRQSRRVVGGGHGLIHVRLFSLDLHRRSGIRLPARCHRCLPHVSRGACIFLRLRFLCSGVAPLACQHGR